MTWKNNCMGMRLVKAAALAFVVMTSMAAASPKALPPDSIYNTQATFTDDSGAKIKLEKLRGSPVVMTFVYTECKSACPLTIERLRQLRKITATDHPEIQFVMVSLDSEHDSPSELHKFRENRKLDGPEWRLLTGADPDIRTLSVLLGYSFQKTGSTENPIAHSNRLVLLDSNGVIISTLEGLNSDVAELAAKIPSK